MIQRIQTVFLLIATGAFITQFFTPILKSSQMAVMGIFQDGQAFTSENQIAIVLLGITMVACIIAIFLFKNRGLQKQIVIISIITLLLGNLFGAYAFMAPADEIMRKSQAQIFPGLGAFMPIIAFAALILAYRGINKDDKIVKSMDRLR